MKKALFMIGEAVGAIRLLITIVLLAVAFVCGAALEGEDHVYESTMRHYVRKDEEPSDTESDGLKATIRIEF